MCIRDRAGYGVRLSENFREEYPILEYQNTDGKWLPVTIPEENYYIEKDKVMIKNGAGETVPGVVYTCDVKEFFEEVEDYNQVVRINYRCTWVPLIADVYKRQAYESAIMAVRLGTSLADGFPRTTQLMRGLDAVVRTAMELGLPTAVNLSFGNTYGSHDGTSPVSYTHLNSGRSPRCCRRGTSPPKSGSNYICQKRNIRITWPCSGHMKMFQCYFSRRYNQYGNDGAG